MHNAFIQSANDTSIVHLFRFTNNFNLINCICFCKLYFRSNLYTNRIDYLCCQQCCYPKAVTKESINIFMPKLIMITQKSFLEFSYTIIIMMLILYNLPHMNTMLQTAYYLNVVYNANLRACISLHRECSNRVY